MTASAHPGRPPQLRPLFEILNRHGVDFVVIGGIAGGAHGSALATFDLDIAYARDDANLDRLAAALAEMDVALRGAPEDLPFQVDAKTLANGSNFTFETAYGSFDVLGHVDGMRDFESLRVNAAIQQIAGAAVRVASICDLIAMKRAANRPKDQVAVEEYIVIADEQKRLAREKKERGED
ncbi:MAG TPA: hypothetical protein VK889_06470 [Solirubrobacterales bacterium]|nr:hypothetical protein [Solirubrobacterales bacterium]